MTALPMSDSGAHGLPSKPGITVDMNLVLWTAFWFLCSMALRSLGEYPAQITWLIADLAVVGLFFRYQSQFINLALGNLIFMSWPLIACLSTLWSISPQLSFSHGIQLLMTTLVAFLICIQLRLEQVVTAIFWAMLLAAVLTVASELLAPGSVGGWRGTFPHKNVMGSSMSLLVITACCLFLQGRWRIVSFAAIGLGAFLVALSQSAAAILSLALTLALLPFAYAYLRGGSTFLLASGLALATAAVGTLVLYISMIALGTDPIEIVLEAFGKERTLTGRTVLWDLADQAMEQRPWLGFGFKGYWTNVPAEMHALRLIVGGVFNFHNNYLDVAVAFGYLGPILLAGGLSVGLVRTTRGLLNGAEPIDMWPLLIVVLCIILTFVENLLMWNHSIWQVLFIVAAVIRK
jgi:exopolysaccharide production protein ExoQ